MLKRILLLILAGALIFQPSFAAGRFSGLEGKLRSIAYKNYGRQVFRGYLIGVSFIDVNTKRAVSVNGSRPFPAASIIKLPVMACLFSMSDRKQINLGEHIYFSDEDKLPGAGILRWLQPNRYTLWNYCRMMISLSDNTATRIIIGRIGRKAVNRYCRKTGLYKTYLLNANPLTEPPDRTVNITTPNDIAKLLLRIQKGAGFTSSSRKDMLSFMFSQKYRFGIPFVLPKGFKCANKTGNISNVLHDCAVVYAPRGKYVLCVFTKGFRHDRSARVVINKVSAAVAGYYK
ncbi:MAG: class A beta-lactamase-related serine hydrolase [Candidatus Saganbacteria bacterium]|nr:class A beta-lactamase-related serine hydrolase [Candidatus Saganbacteria bacterium]